MLQGPDESPLYSFSMPLCMYVTLYEQTENIFFNTTVFISFSSETPLSESHPNLTSKQKEVKNINTFK